MLKYSLIVCCELVNESEDRIMKVKFSNLGEEKEHRKSLLLSPFYFLYLVQIPLKYILETIAHYFCISLIFNTIGK